MILQSEGTYKFLLINMHFLEDKKMDFYNLCLTLAFPV